MSRKCKAGDVVMGVQEERVRCACVSVWADDRGPCDSDSLCSYKFILIRQSKFTASLSVDFSQHVLLPFLLLRATW